MERTSVLETGRSRYTSPFFFQFTFFWLCWIFIVACRLSLVAARVGFSSCSAGLAAPWHVGSWFPNWGWNLRPLNWKADS